MAESPKTQVLIGDTRSLKNVKRLRELGWGRMFAGVRPTPFAGEPWGFDNGAFKNWTDGIPFDEARFLYRTWQAANEVKEHPYLAVVPDIVAAGCSSLAFSLKWVERLRTMWLPVVPHCDLPTPTTKCSVADWKWYLAVQNGMTIHDVKPYLSQFDGIFLGGDDSFKAQAWRWRVFAKDNGKPFHYARAGTLPKLESALKMKADSLDSSFPLWEQSRFERFQAMYAYWGENPRPKLDEKIMGMQT